MRGLALLAFLMALLGTCQPWKALSLVPENPDHLGKCYSLDQVVTPLVMAVDDTLTAPPPDCFEIGCGGPNTEGLYVLDFTGCGSVSVDVPGCRVEEDITLGYPACCPRIVCH